MAFGGMEDLARAECSRTAAFAVNINTEAREKEWRRTRAMCALEDFFRRWEPGDRQDAHRFHAELIHLLQLCTADAVEEQNAMIRRLLEATLPTSLRFIPK